MIYSLTLALRLEPVNPEVPALSDVIWAASIAVAVAIFVVAAVSLIRAYRGLNGTQFFVWTAVILTLPVVGSLAWLTFGRSRNATHPLPADT